MIYIYNILCFLAGYISSSFSVSQILLTISFSIPYTLNLYKRQEISADTRKHINSFNIKVLILHLLIYIAVLSVIAIFVQKYIIAFIIGTAIAILVIISKLGVNENNLSDYYMIHEKLLNTSNSKQTSISLDKVNNTEKTPTKLDLLLKDIDELSCIVNNTKKLDEECIKLLIGKINPYTNIAIENYDDIIIYLTLYLADFNGNFEEVYNQIIDNKE